MAVKLNVSDRYKVEEKSRRYINDAGYLVLPDCVIARSGTLQYSDVIDDQGDQVADGELITVYRPPKALEECCKQFANLPLTLEHPKGDEVNPDNARKVTVGCLGSEPRYEERNGVGYIICDIVVYDKESQERIKNGQTVELSAGYETAFNSNRGMAPGGLNYEAEQYLLSPNHVALVERGRCGSECKVCDSQDQKKGVKKMAKPKKMRNAKKSYRYFIPVGDGDEMMEVTPEQAEIIESNDENEVEEVEEEDFDFDSVGGAEPDTNDTTDDNEDIEEEDETLDDDTTDDDEDIEEEDETLDDEITDEDEDGGDELTFEVQFDDGTKGRMDSNAYEHVQRFLEMDKATDKCGDSLGKVLTLTSRASKILGDSFDIEKYTKADKVDTARIKRDVVKHVMPAVVVDGLKGESLNRLYESACKTHAKKVDSYQNDLENLEKVSRKKADSHEGAGLVKNAQKQYLERLYKKH